MLATNAQSTIPTAAKRGLPMPARGGIKYRIGSTPPGEYKSSTEGHSDEDSINVNISVNHDAHNQMPWTVYDPVMSVPSINNEKQTRPQYPIHFMSNSSMPARASMDGSFHSSTSSRMTWEPPGIKYNQSLTSSRPTKKASVAPAPVTPSPASHRKTVTIATSPTSVSYSPSVTSHLNKSPGPRKDGEADEAWRRHGKLFRANLVLNDEQNGGNSFSLSDSCTIERYYRVADRVLEKFISSNIAERNEMVESFLVGNRLFKFLSVVLPTHKEYFSTDPHLAALRSRSQSQLIEVLEYMEELELMIDEMEYNKYILKDLIPSIANGGTGTDAKDVHKGDESVNPANSFTPSFGEGSFFSDVFSSSPEQTPTGRQSDLNGRKEHSRMGRKSQHRTSTFQSLGPTQQLSKTDRSDVDGSSSQERPETPGGGSFAGRSTMEGSSQRTRSSSRRTNRISNVNNSSEDLEQRVAAVLAVSSALEASTDSSNSTSVGNRSVSRHSSSDAYPHPERGHTATRDHHTGNSAHRRKTSLSMNESFQHSEQGQRNNLKNGELDTSTIWEMDFGKLEAAFSDQKGGKSPSDPASKSSSRIDWLLEEDDSKPGTNKEVKETNNKALPKLKNPPVSYPRSVRAKAQLHASRFSSVMDGTEVDTSGDNDEGSRYYDGRSNGSCDGSNSDIFHSLEEDSLFQCNGGSRRDVSTMALVPTAPKTMIEFRLENAYMRQKKWHPLPSHGRVNEEMYDPHYEESSLVHHSSQRRLLHQFRGCVRSLLE